MKLAIQGIGVVGGFGCGIEALETALINKKCPDPECFHQNSPGAPGNAGLSGGYGQAGGFYK